MTPAQNQILRLRSTSNRISLSRRGQMGRLGIMDQPQPNLRQSRPSQAFLVAPALGAAADGVWWLFGTGKLEAAIGTTLIVALLFTYPATLIFAGFPYLVLGDRLRLHPLACMAAGCCVGIVQSVATGLLFGIFRPGTDPLSQLMAEMLRYPQEFLPGVISGSVTGLSFGVLLKGLRGWRIGKLIAEPPGTVHHPRGTPRR